MKRNVEILSSPVPNPKGPAPTQSNPVKNSSKGTGLTLKSYGPPTPPPPHPTHSQLLSMKEASNKKTQRVKVILDDAL